MTANDNNNKRLIHFEQRVQMAQTLSHFRNESNGETKLNLKK